MRHIRYNVAMSLDGYIAGPNGEADWIVMDPDIDFGALMGSFDTVLVGRKTFEGAPGGSGAMFGMNAIVVSTTLKKADHPKVTIIGDGLEDALTKLKAQPGKDIWLFGGGALFRSLLDLGLVDTVEVSVVPVLLGEGLPLLPPGAQAKLRLTASRVLDKTGTVQVEYAVE